MGCGRIVLTLGAMILVAGACAGEDSERAAPSSSAASTIVESTSSLDEPQPQPPSVSASTDFSATSAFEQTDCFMEFPPGVSSGDDLTCGYVTVPADHADPDGATIRLATAYVNNNSDAPPVVFLPGGPGGSAASSAPGLLGAPFNAIAFDERGVGFSEPSLNCEENDALFLDVVSMPVLDTQQAWSDALADCRDRLAASGVRFELFDSAQSARDIGAVQRALGFEEVTLFGVSYGTRLALTKIRDEPEGIRAVILDSVVPLDVDLLESAGTNYRRALDLLSEQCAASPECQALGDIADLVEQLKAQVVTDPVTVSAPRPFGGGTVDFLVSADRVDLLVFNALYTERDLERLPLILAESVTGDTDSLLPLVQGTVFALDPKLNNSEGYAASVTCREEWPFNDAAATRADLAEVGPGFAAAFDRERDCAIWETTPGPAIENEPVSSSIPALVFAGAFDPVTPPADSRRVAERLTNAVYVEVPSGGHGVAPTTPCTISLVEAIIDDPDAPLDLGCVEALPGPDWQH